MFEGIEHSEESGEKKLSPQETAEEIIKEYDEGQMKIVKQAAENLENAFSITGIDKEEAKRILENIERSVSQRKNTTH